MKPAEIAAVTAVAKEFRPRTGVTGTGATPYLRTLTGGGNADNAESAVAKYLGDPDVFAAVNRTLRSGKTGQDTDAIDAAMIELPDDLLVSRRIPVDRFGDTPLDQLAGMKLRDAAYSPVRLGTVRASTDVRMRIAVPKGTRAVVNPDTGELILDRDIEFAVTRVELNTAGGTDIYLVAKPKQEQEFASTDQPSDARVELARLKVSELRQRAQALGLRPGRARKAELIDMIAGSESGPASGLAASVATGVTSSRRLGGGMQAQTSLVELGDGARAVHKVTNDWVGRPAVEQQDAEELGALVLGAVGLQSPEVFRAAPNEIFMTYFEGKVADEFEYPELRKLQKSGDGILLGLADLLMGNTDRNGGNLIALDEGERIAGIDHGSAFQWHKTYNHPRRPPQFNAEWYRDFVTAAEEWKDNPLTPQDIDVLRERLAGLRDKFAGMRRLGWYKAMMTRLDTIAKHAAGSTEMIR